MVRCRKRCGQSRQNLLDRRVVERTKTGRWDSRGSGLCSWGMASPAEVPWARAQAGEGHGFGCGCVNLEMLAAYSVAILSGRVGF